KIKTTYVLPGPPNTVPGFEVKGNSVSITLDGAKVIAGVHKIYSMDAAEMRKLVRSEKGTAALAELVLGVEAPESTRITVAKPAGPQFDFDKDVKEARAAYPELRKKLNLMGN